MMLRLLNYGGRFRIQCCDCLAMATNVKIRRANNGQYHAIYVLQLGNQSYYCVGERRSQRRSHSHITAEIATERRGKDPIGEVQDQACCATIRKKCNRIAKRLCNHRGVERNHTSSATMTRIWSTRMNKKVAVAVPSLPFLVSSPSR